MRNQKVKTIKFAKKSKN